MTEDVFAVDEKVTEEFTELMRDPAARQAFVEVKRQQQSQGVARRYSNVLRLVSTRPWAVEESVLPVIVDILARRVAGAPLAAEEIEARVAAARRREPAEGAKGVAVIPMTGVLVPKADMFSEVSGGTSIEKLRGQFREAMASPQVSSIVLDVDSPGGMVDGVPEMAAEIRGARGKKPIIAVANHEMASGAYWLASQADEIVVSASSRVGSIGVFTAHEDQSAKHEQGGVKTTLVSAGKFKTEGNPFEPLTDEATAHLQGMVNEYYGMFVGDVAKGRRVPIASVRQGYGEGRVVTGSAALAAGMADREGSVEGVVRELLARSHQEPQQLAAMTPGGLMETSTASTVNLGSVETMSFSTAPPPEAPEATDDGRTVGKVYVDVVPRVDEEHMPALVESLQHFGAAVDNSEWDGNAAMSACDMAACYRAICAGRREGDPNERQSWALPHHKNPSAGPNAAGVRNALARLPQTQGLTNREAAQRHLEAHMREVNPEQAEAGDGPLQAETPAETGVEDMVPDQAVTPDQAPTTPEQDEETRLRAMLARLSQSK
jgi:signal peptide peptidase SppA